MPEKTLKVTHPALYENRSVAIIPNQIAKTMCIGDPLELPPGKLTYLSRSKVVALVEAREMHWVDRHHNGATFTEKAGGTWQKQRSGNVSTMQLRVGRPGRRIPTRHRA